MKHDWTGWVYIRGKDSPVILQGSRDEVLTAYRVMKRADGIHGGVLQNRDQGLRYDLDWALDNWGT